MTAAEPRIRRDTDIEIVLAGDEYGETIGELARANGFDMWEIDWSHVHPNWLVGLFDNKVIGAIQVSPSKPIGRIELLFMWPGLPLRVHAMGVKRLLWSACGILNAQGLQGAIGVVPYELAGYKKTLETTFNAVEINEGHLMLVRFGHGRE